MFEVPRLVPIDHVIDGVYISGWQATQHADYLRQMEITNVLKLYNELARTFPPDLNVFEHPVPDGAFLSQEDFQRGVEFVRTHCEAGQRVLVACAMGISRSSTFVLAYLLESGHSLKDAFMLLRRQHPGANPHPTLWLSLITRYELDCSLNEIFGWYRL